MQNLVVQGPAEFHDVVTARKQVVIGASNVQTGPSSTDLALHSNPLAALIVEGDVVVNGDVRSLTFSSQELKDIWGEVDPIEAAEALRKLRLVRYSYRQDAAVRLGLQPGVRVGVIAEETQLLLPEAVVSSGGRSGELLLAVDQFQMLIYYMAATKHLLKQLNKLRADVDYILYWLYKFRRTLIVCNAFVETMQAISSELPEHRVIAPLDIEICPKYVMRRCECIIKTESKSTATIQHSSEPGKEVPILGKRP